MRDAGYRTTEEIEAWKNRDPITTLKALLLAQERVTAEDAAAIEAEITAIVADALDFATNSPYPDPATATDYVFSTPEEAGAPDA
jgi:TPP-dependent pyruvate/acetoin dehydrogenase alpha subunit